MNFFHSSKAAISVWVMFSPFLFIGQPLCTQNILQFGSQHHLPNCHHCFFIRRVGMVMGRVDWEVAKGMGAGVKRRGGWPLWKAFQSALQFCLLLHECDMCLIRCGWSHASGRNCQIPMPTSVQCTRRASGGVPSPPPATPPTSSLPCRFPQTNHKSTGLAVGWPCCVSWMTSWGNLASLASLTLHGMLHACMCVWWQMCR